MTSKIKVEVESIYPIFGIGPLIVVKTIGCNDVKLESGLELHGCEVVSCDLPRALEDEGSQRQYRWRFFLKNIGDDEKFSIGDFVELSQKK